MEHHSRCFLAILSALIAATLQSDLSISLTNSTSWGTLSMLGQNIHDQYTFCDTSWNCKRANWDWSNVWGVNANMVCSDYLQTTLSYSWALANGTTIQVGSEVSLYQSYDFLQVRFNTYPSQQYIQNFFFTAPLLAYYGQGITVGSVTQPYVVGIAADRVEFGFKGIVHDPTPAGFPSTVTSAEFVEVTHSGSGDVLILKVRFIICTSAPNIQFVDVQIQVIFNHGTGEFDFFFDDTTTTYVTFAVWQMTFMHRAGDLIYMQQASHAFCWVYRISDGDLVSNVAAIQTYPVLQFLQHNGSYYAVFETGIAKLTYDSVMNRLTMNQQTSTFPNGDYRVASLANSTTIIQIGAAQAYVSVTLPPVTPVPAPVTATVPLINFYASPVVEPVQNILISILKTCIAIPGGRRFLSPLFYFFGVFDDLFLFQFHDRVYGDTMLEVFKAIDEIERAKWGIIDYKTMLDTLEVNSTSYLMATEYQEGYLSHNFSSFNRTSTGSEGLMSNCHNFFLISLPLTCAGFLVLWAVFRLSFHYPVSQFFRKFDFVAFLFLLLFDGNIEQFSFHFAAKLQALFFWSFSEKVLKLFITLFGLLLVVVSTGFYLVCFRQYGRLNRLLMDNNRNTLAGQLLLIAQIWFRNMVFGMLNSVLRFLDYPIMLSCLIAVDCLFLGMFTVSLAQDIYKQRFKMWIYLMLGMSRVILTLTFYADYKTVNQPLVEATQQVIVVGQVSIFLLGIVVELQCCLRQLINLVCKMVVKKEPPVGEIGHETSPKQSNGHGGAVLASTINKQKGKCVKIQGVETIITP